MEKRTIWKDHTPNNQNTAYFSARMEFYTDFLENISNPVLWTTNPISQEDLAYFEFAGMEDIRDLQKQIDKLNEELKALEERVTQNEIDIIKLKNEVEVLKERVTLIENRVEIIETILQNLVERMDIAETKIDELFQLIQDLEESFNQQLEYIRQNITELYSKVENNQLRINEIEDRLSKAVCLMQIKEVEAIPSVSYSKIEVESDRTTTTNITQLPRHQNFEPTTSSHIVYWDNILAPTDNLNFNITSRILGRNNELGYQMIRTSTFSIRRESINWESINVNGLDTHTITANLIVSSGPLINTIVGDIRININFYTDVNGENHILMWDGGGFPSQITYTMNSFEWISESDMLNYTWEEWHIQSLRMSYVEGSIWVVDRHDITLEIDPDIEYEFLKTNLKISYALENIYTKNQLKNEVLANLNIGDLKNGEKMQYTYPVIINQETPIPHNFNMFAELNDNILTIGMRFKSDINNSDYIINIDDTKVISNRTNIINVIDL